MEQPAAETIAALRRSGLCEGLTDLDVSRIAREGVLVTFQRGEQIFGENSDANRLYLILRGMVRIETRPPRSDAAGLVLDHLGPGRVLGEVGLIDEQPRSAAAVCEEDATLFTLTRADIERLAESHPAVVSRLYRNIGRDLCQKLRDANEEMREIRAFTGGPDVELEELAVRAHQAQRLFAGYTQEQVDRLVATVAEVVGRQAEDLAAMSVDETGMGRIPDKIAAVRFVTGPVVASWADEQTVGVAREENGYHEVLHPAGPLCLVIPEASCTAATIFHALLCLKTRNAAVLAFPPRAMRSGAETARILYEAALKAGAPEHWLGWSAGRSDHRRTLELVRRPEIKLVIVNGRPALARSLATSGKPILADAAACTPCYVHADADPAAAASDIVFSKTFDHGASPVGEQVVLVHESLASELVGELALRGAAFVGDEARAPLSALLFPVAPREDTEAMLGRSAMEVARLANLQVSSSTSLIAARIDDVGPAEPLAGPKFCPVVGFIQVKDEEQAVRFARIVLEHGGIGHTAVLHARDDALAERFAAELPVLRMLVNSPATQGAWGMTTGLRPSITLGAGTLAGSYLSDNLRPAHVLERRRLLRRHEAVRVAPTAGDREEPRVRRRKSAGK